MFRVMIRNPVRTVRYLGSWLGNSGAVEPHELEMSRDGRRIPATVLVPKGRGAPFPSWIVLHGMTRRGRNHAQLGRFIRALTASRAVVVVPEVPEWIDLDLDPEVTVPTVRGALDLLRSLPEASERVALVGFSFGSPQAILATEHPHLAGELSGAVGFGGYCDLERTVRFQFTGVHEWEGLVRRAPPDPYGRWIVGANFLPAIPGYETANGVADALMALAREAGDREIPARHPTMANQARVWRSRLSPSERGLFDLFAPPDGVDPDPEAVRDLVTGLVRAARDRHPLLEPAERLGAVRHPVHVLHGRGDPLIPYTEALRLQRELTATKVRCTITRLFAHSTRAGPPPLTTLVGEVSAFLASLDRVLGMPEEDGA